MDSDDSYETTSGAFREVDIDLSLSSSHNSGSLCGGELHDLYASTFSCFRPTPETVDLKLSDLTERLKGRFVRSSSSHSTHTRAVAAHPEVKDGACRIPGANHSAIHLVGEKGIRIGGIYAVVRRESQ